MKILQPTMSRTAELLECSWPFGREVPQGGVGEPARYGLAFHEVMARFLDPQHPPLDHAASAQKWGVDHHELYEHTASASKILTEWLSGRNPYKLDFTKGKIEVEKSYALKINLHSGLTVLPSSRKISNPTEEDHTYEDLLPGEQGGTADLVVVLGKKVGRVTINSTVLVLDHKTGAFGNFSRPNELPQLRSLSLAVAAFYKAPRVIAAVLHAPRRGIPQIYSEELTNDDAFSHMQNLHAQMSRIGDGSMRPGPWCERCPAQSICPAQAGNVLERSTQIVLAATNEGDLSKVRMSFNLSEAQQVGRLHQLFGQFSKLEEMAKAKMKAWILENGAAERPDGKVVDLIPKKVESVSKSSIVRALGKLEGEKLIARGRKEGWVEMTERVEMRAKNDD